MIKKIRIRGFKKFAKSSEQGFQEFEIPHHLVMVGPNNSGKTSLLQAVGTWMEIALRWSQSNPDLARDGRGDYLPTNITVDSFGSVPLADFDHLWADKKTDTPLEIWLETDRWKIGFEFQHKEMELIAVRPASVVKEDALRALKGDLDDSHEKSGRFWRPVYIPPISGLEVQESRFAEEATILNYLAKADAGKVLRNLLLRTHENGDWDKLNETIKRLFGHELMPPSSGAFIHARYRHPAGEAYDLSSAASGFLQVLLVYAAIFGQPSAVYLLDEPDAHLHLSMQSVLFRDLLKRARKDKFQVIVATHSERLIQEAGQSDLRLLDADGILKKVNTDKVISLLDLALPVELVEAINEQRLLYLEGPTDIEILRLWAATLEHPCLSFLKQATPVETAQRGQEPFIAKHFSVMRELVPKVRGVELLDGDRLDGDRKPSGRAGKTRARHPEQLKPLFWERKEIESYLLHPDSVVRYLQSKTSPANVKKAEKYMRVQLPQKFIDDPFGKPPFLFLDRLEVKKFFSYLFQEAGLSGPSKKDFLLMAKQMKVGEIHPEVKDKLNQIFEHLHLSERKTKVGEHGSSAAYRN